MHETVLRDSVVIQKEKATGFSNIFLLGKKAAECCRETRSVFATDVSQLFSTILQFLAEWPQH